MIDSRYDSTTAELVLDLRTDLLSSNAEAMAREFEKQLANVKGMKAFTLDLRRCSMVDSVGLNLIFSLLSRCKEHGSAPKVIIAKGHLERIMAVAQMGKLFTVEVV